MSFTDVQLMQDRLHAKTSEFQNRIAETHKFIDFVLSHVKIPYVACSFGKDSIVMLHLILQHRKDIPVYSFSNKQYDFPDTHRLRWELQEKWNLNMILIERDVSKAVETEDEGGAYNRLYFLVLREQVQKHQWNCAFVGKRKQEAPRRKREIDEKGNFFPDAINGKVAYPLADWTVKDIWAYSTLNSLPHHEIYDKQNCGLTRDSIRLGIMFDPLFDRTGEQIWMKKNYPELYNRYNQSL
jgi:3'-phosphoadenosine 5'-phosphosulfate sulfotransferase (PAPS reductase)/FAD synthetase